MCTVGAHEKTHSIPWLDSPYKISLNFLISPICHKSPDPKDLFSQMWHKLLASLLFSSSVFYSFPRGSKMALQGNESMMATRLGEVRTVAPVGGAVVLTGNIDRWNGWPLYLLGEQQTHQNTSSSPGSRQQEGPWTIQIDAIISLSGGFFYGVLFLVTLEGHCTGHSLLSQDLILCSTCQAVIGMPTQSLGSFRSSNLRDFSTTLLCS